MCSLRKFSGDRRLSNSDMPLAKAQRRKVRRGKIIFLRMIFTFFLRPLRPWRLCERYSEFRSRLFADRRTSFYQRSLGKSVYYYSSEFARLAQIFRGRKFSDLKIPPAKTQRRQVRRGKINIFTNSFQHFFRPLRPLRLRSGHAWRPFGRVYPELSRRAQDMLCGRYFEFWLRRGRVGVGCI